MYTAKEMAKVFHMNEAVLLNHVQNLFPLEPDILKSDYFRRKGDEWFITFKGVLYLFAHFGIDRELPDRINRFEDLFLLKNGIWGI